VHYLDREWRVKWRFKAQVTQVKAQLPPLCPSHSVAAKWAGGRSSERAATAPEAAVHRGSGI
jgi:hypothetical protein